VCESQLPLRGELELRRRLSLAAQVSMLSRSLQFSLLIYSRVHSCRIAFRALAVVSRERFSGSGSRKFKEVEVHCTEANIVKEDTFGSRSEGNLVACP
jgi:hypothetical protein